MANSDDKNRVPGEKFGFQFVLAPPRPTRAAASRPLGIGDFPPEDLGYFNWGAFAQPLLWGLAYGVWQLVAVASVVSLAPVLLLSLFPQIPTDELSVQFGLLAVSGVLSAAVRAWSGMVANRYAWEREALVVKAALSGRPRRDVGWFSWRQRRWFRWGNIALLVASVFVAYSDYGQLARVGAGVAIYGMVEHAVWLAAAYIGGWWISRGWQPDPGRVVGADGVADGDYGDTAYGDTDYDGTDYADADYRGADSQAIDRNGADVEERTASASGVDFAHMSGDDDRSAAQTTTGPIPVGYSEFARIPVLGFGTYKIPPGRETYDAVLEALRVGYRHIDTATLYGNEESVGSAIRDSGLDRDEVFITTKLWNDDQGYGNTLRAFDRSLEALGTDYVDLYLVHWPVGEHLESTWRAMQHIHRSGRAREVGVCNFDVVHLERLAAVTDYPPSVNQFELHPRFQRPELVALCREYGIDIEAWAPLMRGEVFDIPDLVDLGERHGKTAGQVALRWALQSGFVVMPKSVHPARIAENADIFDFELAEWEMAQIGMLDAGQRVGPDPDKFSWNWPDSER